MNAPKKRKLLIQIGIIFALIFIFVTPVIVVIQITGNLGTYLEAKREHLTPILEHTANDLSKNGPVFEWLLDMWETHADELKEFLSDENNTVVAYPDEVEDLMMKEEVSMDEVNKLTDDDKILFSMLYFKIFQMNLDLMQYSKENEIIMIISLKKENLGFIYDIGHGQGLLELDTDTMLGEKLWQDDEIPDIMNEYVAGTRSDITFERVEIKKAQYYSYVGYKPVSINGKPRFAVCVLHDWSQYHTSMLHRLYILVAVSLGIFALAAVVLLAFVNKVAIHPLKSIQKTVRTYMQDKDSRGVTEAMDRVTQKNEFGVLAEDISDLAVEIDRYNTENARLIGEQKRLETELNLAAAIQKGVLPADFPEEQEYVLYASMTPAKEVGGDLYDYFSIDDSHVGLVIGDVSGKGIPASLFMMITKKLLKQYALAGNSPSEVLRLTNVALCEDNVSDMFVTVWFGILDLSSGRIVAANAGHENPMLRGKEGPFEMFRDKHGFVLGGMDMSRYKEYELTLEPGGTLFVYTDGAAEATNTEEQLFGTDRMLEALNQDPSLMPKELCETMSSSIDAFVGDAPQFDDLTMLCVRYNGKKGS